jgi:hypothetical protein
MAFDEQAYLNANPDVLLAVANGGFVNAQQHYEMYGQKEGRDPTGQESPFGDKLEDVQDIINGYTVIGRLPDLDGFNYWVDQVAQGNLTGVEAMSAIINSPEGKGEVDSPAGEYSSVAGTTAVSGGSSASSPATQGQAVDKLADLYYRSMTTGVSTSELNSAVIAAGGDPNDPFAAGEILKNAGYTPGSLEDFYTSAGDEPDDPATKALYEAREELLEDGTNSNLQNLGYLKSQGFDVDTSQYDASAQQQIEQAAQEFSPEETTEEGDSSSVESVSGNIVPGVPQVGEVNVMDYMGLQAAQPTLPVGTQLEPDLAQIEATDETLQALTPEQQLATDGQYVATPQEITASTVTSPTPQDAVTATASTTDLVDQPEAVKMTAERSLEQINEEADALQAARQDLSEIDPKATVQGQLALLQEQFADGEVPVWAQGAFRQVNSLMAQRGIGGSTIAAEAITNALMQSTLPIAQQDASFYQNVTLQNLSNEQQAEMAKFNARTTAIFNDQAAENAARSLNTQSANELTRFFAELSQNVALANTAQTNAMEQFNATAQNQMTQFFEELGLTAETFNADAINEMSQFDAEQANIISQFNASMKDQRERFNVQNQLAIDASNVNWRREVNTANTAATNAALQFDAQNLLAVQQTALNNIWQHYDSLLDFAFRAEEGAMDRASNLAIASMSAEMQRQIAEAEADTGLISSIFEGGTRLLASESGKSLFSELVGI